MIVTVTPNPSVDRTVEVSAIVPGGVARSDTRRVQPGGKGINVARALLANDVDAVAVLPLGGAEGDQLAALLDEAAVPHAAVALREPIRSNLTVVEPDGTTTKFNEAGPTLSSDEVDRLLATVLGALDGAAWLVSAGSLPVGVTADLHARLVTAAAERDVTTAIDTTGAPLLLAVEAGAALVKPNTEELAEAAGRPLVDLGDVVGAAEELRGRGARAVLASLGADGAVLVDGAGALFAAAPPVIARSTVGAGDCFLAGYLAALAAGGGRVEALRAAVAFGTAAVQLPGTTVPGPGQVHPDLVVVTDDIDFRTPVAQLQQPTDHGARISVH